MICSRLPHNSKIGLFTSWKERERLRNVKSETCTCKACKPIVFHCQICKFVTCMLPSSSWLLKLPTGANQVGEKKSNFTQIIPDSNVIVLQRTSKQCVKVRATPGARLFFPCFKLMRSLFSGAVVSVAVNV